MSHFVVLKKIDRDYAYILDPAIGERKVSLNEVDNCFTGIAIEVQPSSGFQEGNDSKKINLSMFWASVSGLKRSLIVVLLLSLMLQFFALASPYYMQLVVDNVFVQSNFNLLTVLSLGFALLLILETSLSVLRQFVTLRLSNLFNVQTTSNIFSHLIRLPLDYFSKRSIGDISSRFSSMSPIRAFIANSVTLIVLDSLLLVITLGVMLVYDYTLTIIVLVSSIAYVLLRFLTFPTFRKLNEESIVLGANENTHFLETLRSIQTIKTLNIETLRQNNWQNKFVDATNKQIEISKYSIYFSTANKLIFGIENIVIIYMSALLVMGGHMSLGMFYAFVSYKIKFVSSMNSLADKYIEYKMLDLHLDRLGDVFLSKQEPVYSPNKNEQSFNDIPTQRLIARQLAYQFGSEEKPIFDPIELSIKQNEFVCITGDSGCGKSTLLKLLMGLYTPTLGEVYVGNTPINYISNYRQVISSVAQEDQLLSGTIAENIASFNPNVDMAQVIKCATIACIDQDIARLPMRYHSFIGDMGSMLSSGQRQRILIARALYSKPKILFLDEATSHLDIKTESKINSNIKELNITRVIVAHRPETIRSADRVISLSRSNN